MEMAAGRWTVQSDHASKSVFPINDDNSTKSFFLTSVEISEEIPVCQWEKNHFQVGRKTLGLIGNFCGRNVTNAPTYEGHDMSD